MAISCVKAPSPDIPAFTGRALRPVPMALDDGACPEEFTSALSIHAQEAPEVRQEFIAHEHPCMRTLRLPDAADTAGGAPAGTSIRSAGRAQSSVAAWR
jgi:hypothetical protein